MQESEGLNPDVMGVKWLPYDDSNPIMELNMQSVMSTQADQDECAWIDEVFSV